MGVPAPMVGAYVGAQTGDPDLAALWRAAQRAYGPLHVWRCFDGTIKPPEQARFTRVPGPIPFYSLKPPGGDHAGFAAGQYTQAYQAVISALPAEAVVTVWHEPENDMTGAEFAALTRRAYDDTKAVRADVTYAYAAMAYQWEQVDGATADPSGWLEAARIVDMVTVDVYAPAWRLVPMGERDGFQRWWREIVEPAGRPWGVSERGISADQGEDVRINVLMADWEYACTHDAALFLYWDADWRGNSWKLTGAGEIAAMGRIAAQGRPR